MKGHGEVVVAADEGEEVDDHLDGGGRGGHESGEGDKDRASVRGEKLS